jgi:hypothetical protein
MRTAILYYERVLPTLVPSYLLPIYSKDDGEEAYYLYCKILLAIYSQLTYRRNLNRMVAEKIVRNLYQAEAAGLMNQAISRGMISKRLYTEILYNK